MHCIVLYASLTHWLRESFLQRHVQETQHCDNCACWTCRCRKDSLELVEQARLLQLLFGSLTAKSQQRKCTPPVWGWDAKTRMRDPVHRLFLSSAHMSPTDLFVIGGAFMLESVVWYIVLVRYLEFRGCPLFGSS